MITKNLKLDALAWKAKCVGESYGKLSARLSKQEKELIFAEYEQLVEKRQKEEEDRLKRVKSEKGKKKRIKSSPVK